jgi:hypothetical protein
VNGSTNPELFLPHELFDHLIHTCFPADGRGQTVSRRMVERRAAALGLGSDLWQRLGAHSSAHRAVAELDDSALGGNGDGKVDAADSAFESLCVWNDQNRNGISEPGELHAAARAGVISLEYAYLTTRYKDSFGNLFRYVSLAHMRTQTGRSRAWPTFDVIFASAD